MMRLHERVELAKQLLDQAHDLRANARGVMADFAKGRATQLEGRATAHATVALAEMLCQQSVCGHGVLLAHDDQSGSSMCLP